MITIILVAVAFSGGVLSGALMHAHFENENNAFDYDPTYNWPYDK